MHVQVPLGAVTQTQNKVQCKKITLYLYSDSLLREDLELGPVIGHVSEELLLNAIPLDAVQGVTLHVKPGGKISKIHSLLHYVPLKIHI